MSILANDFNTEGTYPTKTTAPTPAELEAQKLLLPAGFVAALQAERLHVRLLLPGDPEYAKRLRQYNARYDSHRPWAIALCLDEVGAKVSLGAVFDLGLRFRLRSAGHSLGGFSSIEQGVLVHLGELNAARLDVANRELWVGCGTTQLQIGQALEKSGLMLPLGDGPVGTGGFVEAGGFGETSRTHGMNSDRAIEVRVMLADGQIVHATEQANHDLWWAVRGGTGGNFGILLEVRYALASPSEQYLWDFSWPLGTVSDRERAVTVFGILQDLIDKTGPNFNVGADIRRYPKVQGGPNVTPRLVVGGTYLGPQAECDPIIEPLRAIADNGPFDPPGRARMSILRKSRLLSKLTPAAWRTVVDDFLEIGRASCRERVL